MSNVVESPTEYVPDAPEPVEPQPVRIVVRVDAPAPSAGVGAFILQVIVGTACGLVIVGAFL